MAQHYSDPKRESDPHALPDLETFQADAIECLCCEEPRSRPEWTHGCPNCGNRGFMIIMENAWYYWFCSPGCLPDSDPIGPFATEAEALKDARKDG